MDGECLEQCDCGAVNPCGEYIMDHRSTVVVDGQSFREWFINDVRKAALRCAPRHPHHSPTLLPRHLHAPQYMISNETLYHKDPVTGKPAMISLGFVAARALPARPPRTPLTFSCPPLVISLSQSALLAGWMTQ